MSLLGVGGGGGMTGDIWSTGAFSFESPLKELLDSGDYTLEQLLAEDELLQELRGIHPTLIHFFSTEEAVTKLVQYLILPPDTPWQAKPTMNGTSSLNDEAAPESAAAAAAAGEEKGEDAPEPAETLTKPKDPGEWFMSHEEEEKEADKSDAKKKTAALQDDPDMLHVRFPFMACEIVCCEITGILDALATGRVATGLENKKEAAAGSVSDEIQSHGDSVEVVAEPGPPRILDLLFSVLFDTEPGKMDDYRAGYFDKILSVLFRKKPVEMSEYLNSGGSRGRDAMMKAMFSHLYSHSIMQIAQRLLLPQRPVPQQEQQQQATDDAGEGGDELMVDTTEPVDDEGPAFECDWSTSQDALDMLLNGLLGDSDSSSSSSPKEALTPLQEEQRLNHARNTAEVLITMIQHSLLSSSTMLSLTSSETLGRLITASVTPPTITSTDGEGNQVETEYFSPHESMLTCAMSVLESLILQLGGYGAVGTMSIMPTEEEAPAQQQDGEGDESAQKDADADSGEKDEHATTQENDHLIADVSGMLEHLPRLLDSLSKLLRHPCTKEWTSPMQYVNSGSVQLLGTSRLRIIRLLEAFVLLSNPEIDSFLVEASCLEIALDLFWEFQWCSMLHQTVANLLVHVFEGRNSRVEMQDYFINRCNLMKRLLNSFTDLKPNPTEIPDVVMDMKNLKVENSALSSVAGSGRVSPADPLPVSEDDVDAALEQQEETEAKQLQVKAENDPAEGTSLISTEAVQFESRDASTIGVGAPPQSFRFGYMGHVIIICQALVHASTEEEDDDEGDEDGEANIGDEQWREDDDVTKEPLMLNEMIQSHELIDNWLDFVTTTLATETATQAAPLGGFNGSANDPLQSHRPGLAEGDDGLQMPPRGMLGGGDVIDMDDNDLDVAASMMVGLSLGGAAGDDDDGDYSGSGDSGDSQRTYESGETANSGGYLFEDPLGKAKGGLGIELGKLTQYVADDGSDEGQANDSDENSSSSSDEEPDVDTKDSSDDDVVVMDLFAGNFSYDKPPEVAEAAEAVPAFADFANFAAFAAQASPEPVADEEVFGAFSSANDAVPSNSKEGSSSSASKEEIEKIFGEGDHADLLETEDPVTEPNPADTQASASPAKDDEAASPTEGDSDLSEEPLEISVEDVVPPPSNELDSAVPLSDLNVSEPSSSPETDAEGESELVVTEDSGPVDEPNEKGLPKLAVDNAQEIPVNGSGGGSR